MRTHIVYNNFSPAANVEKLRKFTYYNMVISVKPRGILEKKKKNWISLGKIDTRCVLLKRKLQQDKLPTVDISKTKIFMADGENKCILFLI